MLHYKFRRFSCALAAFVALAGPAGAVSDPEGESQKLAKQEVVTHKYMVVAANPLASKAGADMIAAGGSAADAAIASSTLADARVGACVAGAVRRWQFPRCAAQVSYPFVFVPGGD